MKFTGVELADARIVPPRVLDEHMEAIIERSGLKQPGGFRRLVLDRLDALDQRLEAIEKRLGGEQGGE